MQEDNVKGLRLFPLLFILLMSAWGIYLAATWLRADLYARRVQQALDAWGEHGAVTSLASWEDSLWMIDRAIALRQREPNYHRLKGTLYEWRGFAVDGVDISAADLVSSRRQAVGAYRETVRLLPAHGADWSRFARSKVLAGEADAEFERALTNAMALGRHIPQVQLDVVFTASVGWNQIRHNETLFTAMKEFVGNALAGSGNVRAMVDYLRRVNLLGEVCPELAMAEVGEIGRAHV